MEKIHKKQNTDKWCTHKCTPGALRHYFLIDVKIFVFKTEFCLQSGLDLICICTQISYNEKAEKNKWDKRRIEKYG